MSDLLTVRYPSGETESRMRDGEPQVGDALTRTECRAAATHPRTPHPKIRNGPGRTARVAFPFPI